MSDSDNIKDAMNYADSANERAWWACFWAIICLLYSCETRDDVKYIKNSMANSVVNQVVLYNTNSDEITNENPTHVITFDQDGNAVDTVEIATAPKFSQELKLN